ncbi:MAG: isoprenyl transferase [Rhizobiales bacterium]|nr:isoprenyl transferase [Hyphomicrobiales bacterium]
MSDASLIPFAEDEPSHPRMPRHVAIIMDGNGRWAKERGLPRIEGHRKGVEAVREITRVAGECGLDYLTLFSFSSENWNRPKSEIAELFSLMRLFIRKYLAELHQNNVRLITIGSESGVPDDITRLIKDAITLTAGNNGLTLVIAFNYGARAEILSAVQRIAAAVAAGSLSPDAISIDLISQHLQTAAIPDPDLIIRTSGEQRLSNFLLWQAAYSEFFFTECKWPDFGEAEFLRAIDDYFGRERRFGAISSAKSGG